MEAEPAGAFTVRNVCVGMMKAEGCCSPGDIPGKDQWRETSIHTAHRGHLFTNTPAALLPPFTAY